MHVYKKWSYDAYTWTYTRTCPSQILETLKWFDKFCSYLWKLWSCWIFYCQTFSLLNSSLDPLVLPARYKSAGNCIKQNYNVQWILCNDYGDSCLVIYINLGLSSPLDHLHCSLQKNQPNKTNKKKNRCCKVVSGSPVCGEVRQLCQRNAFTSELSHANYTSLLLSPTVSVSCYHKATMHVTFQIVFLSSRIS